jgi:hypothetical protein
MVDVLSGFERCSVVGRAMEKGGKGMEKWWKMVFQAARETSYTQLTVTVHLHLVYDRICGTGTGGGVVFVTD